MCIRDRWCVVFTAVELRCPCSTVVDTVDWLCLLMLCDVSSFVGFHSFTSFIYFRVLVLLLLSFSSMSVRWMCVRQLIIISVKYRISIQSEVMVFCDRESWINKYINDSASHWRCYVWRHDVACIGLCVTSGTLWRTSMSYCSAIMFVTLLLLLYHMLFTDGYY